MKNKFLKLLAIIAIFSSVYSIAGEFHVDKGKKNQVKFISHANIEDFEGTTEKIDGFLKTTASDDALLNSEFYFEVDMNSLDTGLGLRNRHMRENYLHTDKYPKGAFKGTITKENDKGNGKSEIEATGNIQIHGVTKPIVIKALCTKTEGNTLVECKFVISLTDHNIEIPQLMLAKVSKNIDVSVNFNVKKVK